jgi:hypothetical protein
MYLTTEELKTKYFKKAANMLADDVDVFLARANSYALGIIGGIPPYSENLPEENVKAAVAMAFEVFAEGEDAKTDPVNGNITAAAPSGFFVRKKPSPLETVDKMLAPYAAAYEASNTSAADNGVLFL